MWETLLPVKKSYSYLKVIYIYTNMYNHNFVDLVLFHQMHVLFLNRSSKNIESQQSMQVCLYIPSSSQKISCCYILQRLLIDSF